ncbi:hypothetical protein WICPIJ_005879 [Wickerhamomyces pijperi]|uniref:SEC7 domain-containing protein n=1 Tax=Wickerhamomyces pijperi TaxID=599730 RepID=A0A9P8TLX0_WICPI|nr:hypothetical protein WICPIJ_005879 [Wickerhamomyces pijperi]
MSEEDPQTQEVPDQSIALSEDATVNTDVGSRTSQDGAIESSASSVVNHPEPSPEMNQESEVSPDHREHSDSHELPPIPVEEDGEDVTESTEDIPTPLPKINIEAANAVNVGGISSNSTHPRAMSIISSASNSTTMAPNASHVGFVKAAITRISEQKEVKKQPILLNSTKKTLEKLEAGGFDSYLVFECLRLSTESKIPEVVLVALDCLSKIFTFQLFEQIQVPPPKSITAPEKDDLPANEPSAATNCSIVTPPPKINIIDAAIETIAATFEGEGTDERIEIQVTRALLAATLNEQMPPHGSTLLRSIRQIYNIFILSLSPANQGIAQASLTQIVNTIFERAERLHKQASTTPRKSSSSVNFYDSDKSSRNNSLPNISTPEAPANSEAEPLTLQTLNDLNDEQERIVDQENNTDNESEQTVKDAFLLFRAMCKLSVKNLENDSLDLRSHAVRSKLISLHIIHSIIKEHIDVFLASDITIRSSANKEPTKFVDAIRQYLCLTISRNAASSVSPVFETTLEIFWLIISNLRSQFKREIPVFLNEIYFPVAELKTATAHQKRYFLIVIQRLSNDPRAIVEFYLNYDCDPSLPNICERLTDYLTKLALTRVEITPSQKAQYREHATKSISTYNLSQLPLLSISKLSSQSAITDNALYPVEYALKIIALNSIVGIIRSLNSWTQKGFTPETRVSSLLASNRKRSSTFGSVSQQASTPIASTPTISSNLNESLDVDDPTEFESLKQRKTALLEGIRQFNFKPKRGIDYLLKQGFISDRTPQAIAKFLLEQEGLDKAVIGEYMGEGSEENIAIMHAYVDSMEFNNTFFVDAMRTFLQGFRLPGEAQKIDRYMLKFAEKYTEGNPGVFAYADTAYVLAFSVIMLNTDQHSKSVKVRMTIDDFIKNNRGIDDGKSLPDEYLVKIFNEIATNEIKLDSEQRAALLNGDLNPASQQSFGLFGGRDVNREAYNQASREISSKTEQAFKNLSRSRKNDVFYSATHIDHVKNIFDTLWMSFLAALTSPFKELDDEETIKICLEGLKLSIGIASVFELDYARTSFVGALVQFANVSNYNDLENKNVEAIILLLKIAELNGDQLKDSWKDILTLISQVERLQLIAKGIQADSLPDIGNAKVHRQSMESQRTSISQSNSNSLATTGYSLFGFGKKTTLAEQAQISHHSQQLNHLIGQRLISADLTVHIDKVYTQSAQLNGTAIIDFIRALTEVATEEIESSLDSATPRTFSLQKVVDVCYYNMGRIRLEWSPIWAVMGECFNDIGTKHNLSIVFFALDSLRQLSMRFMDIEELAGFKFQENFLKPFAHILEHTREEQVTEMVLNCLENLIKVKGVKIKSGWKTIFVALKFSSLALNGKLVSKSFEICDVVYESFYENILVSQEDTFALLSVLGEISKNSRFPKIALHSLQTLKNINTRIANLNGDESQADHAIIAKNHNDVFKSIWYPALASFNEVIMKCDDLEIRSKALNYLFDILVQYGHQFDDEHWSLICNELLFTIFGALSNHWEITQFSNHDDLSVWLSTTLIQALRNMIALFTHYFDALSKLLDGYLDLLISCICQENDTIARIGRSCLQQLITQNMDKFQEQHWDKITHAFERLFDLTAAKELFDADPLKKENGAAGNEQKQEQEPQGTESEATEGKIATGLDKASSKNVIVVKCILQLLMIESLSELFENEDFYNLISYEHLTRLSALLEKSFRFARTFNDDYNLRVRLWNAGVIEKLPNLLKQESSSAAVYISVTFKLYSDTKKITPKQKDIISTSLIPMCGSIVERYVQLDDATQQRNVTIWRPVVVEILQGYCELEERDFNKNCPHVYDLVLNILDKSVPAELRTAIKAFFARVGDVYINEEKN